MARRARSAILETRSTRLKLPVRKNPYPAPVAAGIVLHYRRTKRGGTWTCRLTRALGGADRTVWLGLADDYADANDNDVLSYWQASDKARAVAKLYQNAPVSEGPVTVATALGDYAADLKVRGGSSGNATRVCKHLPPQFRDAYVATLKSQDLRRWRDTLAKTLAPATVNRIVTGLKAALNLAASHDEAIATRPWEIGLAALHGASRPRNVILDDDTVRDIVSEAYRPRPLEDWIVAKADRVRRAQAEAKAAEWAECFGLLVEVLATTGSRISQAARLDVGDLQDSRSDPRLMMPSSAKGRGEKKITRRPVPIPPSLAARLRAAATERLADAPLLVKPTGDRWAKSDHSRPFQRVVQRLNLDAEVTIYSLRHSSIVRALLAGQPIRLVAANHDTSVSMIEKNYSSSISDHADALARRGLLDIAAPVVPNIMPLRPGATATGR